MKEAPKEVGNGGMSRKAGNLEDFTGVEKCRVKP